VCGFLQVIRRLVPASFQHVRHHCQRLNGWADVSPSAGPSHAQPQSGGHPFHVTSAPPPARKKNLARCNVGAHRQDSGRFRSLSVIEPLFEGDIVSPPNWDCVDLIQLVTVNHHLQPKRVGMRQP